MQFEEGVRLSELTTFKIGGVARYFTTVTQIAELSSVIAYCHKQQLRYFLLGKGSNTLFDDRGFDGLVVLMKIGFMDEKQGVFDVGAGYSFSLLGSQTARKGWAGLEFASGIPGSVGGAVYMNAGASGGETFNCLTQVTYVTEEGAVQVIPKADIAHGYRFSSFQNQKGAIAAAQFSLTPSTDARKRQLDIIDYRTRTQPYSIPSAGCVFRNPPSLSSGQLIEKAGLKGVAIGGAEVSPMHANFIVNTGKATATQVMELAQLVRQTVKDKCGVELEMEIRKIPYD